MIQLPYAAIHIAVVVGPIRFKLIALGAVGRSAIILTDKYVLGVEGFCPGIIQGECISARLTCRTLYICW
jgi:hypothetical protein